MNKKNILILLLIFLKITLAYSYATSQLDAANSLAEKGIINYNKSNPGNYNLDQNVLRQEIAAVARGVAGLDKKVTCRNKFSDISSASPNNWACSSVEVLLENDIISANNLFRPEEYITKSEALGMIVKSAGFDYKYNKYLGTTWQSQIVNYAFTKGIIAKFTDYNTYATRGWVFKIANISLSKKNISNQLNNPVYVTFYSHNEVDGIRQNYLDNETKYKEYRNDLIKKIKLLNSYGIKLNWETDTTILLAMKKWEKGSLLSGTNNKNILRWMVEDMNMIIDPHGAKDNAYNYADIVYMIEEFGVKPSGVVGGFILYSCDNNGSIQTKDSWYKEIGISEDGLIYGQKYPNFSWKPTIIGQPAMIGHNYDEFSSGVWKPSESNFKQNSTSGKYIYVGQGYPHTKKLIPNSFTEIFVNDTEYIEELIEKIDSGELSNKEMYTTSIHLRDDPDTTTYDNLKDFLESLEKIKNKNKIMYLDYESVGELWQEKYSSIPSKVEISNFSFYNDILSNTCKSNNLIQNINNINTQKCGDGICDSIEQKNGVCDTDCK